MNGIHVEAQRLPAAPHVSGLAQVLPNPLKLIAFDFDGVMTDNGVLIDEDGREWVRCSRFDGMGITLLRRAGVPMIVLSTEKNKVVQARCRKLQLECIHGCDDKTQVFRDLLRHRGISPEAVVFVGNDVNDLGCLELAGCSVVVGDAHPQAVAVADHVLKNPGGHGAVREFCDAVLECMQLRKAG